MTLGMTISKTHMRSGVLNVGTSQKPHRVVTRTAMLAALPARPPRVPGVGRVRGPARTGDIYRSRTREALVSLTLFAWRVAGTAS